MADGLDLETTIADAVNDAQISDVDTNLDEGSDNAEVVDTPAVETPTETAPEAEAPAAETQNQQVAAPGAAQEATPQDEFDKLAGVPKTGFGGRENRIPYSRVKKITENAVNEIAEVALGRKLNQGEKAVDVVKAHVARIPELETKVTDYESRLNDVGQFEQVMANDPQRFLGMLSKVPAYREFFSWLDRAAEVMEKQAGAPAAGTPDVAAAPVADPNMPQPDEELSDGSKVYSMEGLQKLLDWKANQVATNVEARLTKQFEQQYKPMADDWQTRRRIEAARPFIQKQLEDAKKWPLFTESEDDIIKILRANPNISLEGAYREAVFPKLVADRNKAREQVIRDIQAAPTSTSVPSRVATKPSAPAPDGPRKLEDIIKEQVDSLKR